MGANPGTSVAALARRRDLRILAVVVAVELALVAFYFAVIPAVATRPRYVLYPFAWINAGLWAVIRVDTPRASPGQRAGATVIAALYFLLLAWIAGLIGIAVNVPEFTIGVTIGQGSPGWERVTVLAPPVYAVFIPYRVLGYVALSYLVYATVLDTARSALAGAIGVVSCLSCTFPIVVSLVAGITGGTAGLTGAIYDSSVDISTAVYLLAVGLLYWRPGIGTVRRWFGK